MIAEQEDLQESRCQDLTRRLDSLRASLAAAATEAYAARSRLLVDATSGLALSSSVSDLAGELQALTGAQEALDALQRVQASIRAARGHGAGASVKQAAFAIDCLAKAAVELREAHERPETIPGAIFPFLPLLQRQAQQAAEALIEGFRHALQSALQEAQWPPSFLLARDEQLPAWEGLDAAAICAAAGCLTLAERRLWPIFGGTDAQHQGAALERGDPSQSGRLALEQLCVGVHRVVATHFASGSNTDRPDRPEWALSAVERAIKRCCTALGAAPGLQHAIVSAQRAPLGAEEAAQEAAQDAPPQLTSALACALLRCALRPLLEQHIFPEYIEYEEPSLWLHFADEAEKFADRVGWLLDPEGLEDAELDESGPAAGPRHADLPLSVLAGDERARPTWLAAERHDATALVEDLCAAPAVWEPVEGLLRGVFDSDSDEEGGAGGQRDRGEFRPPLLADEVVRAVRAQLLRARRLPIHGTRVAFIEGVTLPMLASVRGHLQRLVESAVALDEVLGETWRPRFCAVLCAAHYLEHQLGESQGLQLLASALDDAADPASSTVSKLLEQQSASFATFRRRWTNQLALQTMKAFRQLFDGYRRDKARFVAGWDDGSGSPIAASPRGYPLQESEACPPCPELLRAADGIHSMLSGLGGELDAAVHAAVWRALAQAINRAFYNEVATEVLFSPLGARLFQADLGAVVAVFGLWSRNPAVHFRESTEACRLLNLPEHDAKTLAQKLRVTVQQSPQKAGEAESSFLNALTGHQALRVLGQRMDVAIP